MAARPSAHALCSFDEKGVPFTFTLTPRTRTLECPHLEQDLYYWLSQKLEPLQYPVSLNTKRLGYSKVPSCIMYRYRTWTDILS